MRRARPRRRRDRETVGRRTQRELGIDVELAGNVDRCKQQIAELGEAPFGRLGRLDFVELVAHLLQRSPIPGKSKPLDAARR